MWSFSSLKCFFNSCFFPLSVRVDPPWSRRRFSFNVRMEGAEEGESATLRCSTVALTSQLSWTMVKYERYGEDNWSRRHARRTDSSKRQRRTDMKRRTDGRRRAARTDKLGRTKFAYASAGSRWIPARRYLKFSAAFLAICRSNLCGAETDAPGTCRSKRTLPRGAETCPKLMSTHWNAYFILVQHHQVDCVTGLLA